MTTANTTNILIVVTVVFISVCAGEDFFEETGVSEEPRVLRKEIREDQWRAVENIHLDRSGWIPDVNLPQDLRTDSQLPKRRRLRKRKRRPPMISLTDDPDVVDNRYPLRRIKRPQHLHEEQELWSQMEEDAKVRTNKRRRIIPLYHDNFGEKNVEIQVDEKISVFQADEGLSEDRVSTETIPDLKTLLKQAGGLSLSEILQQKNLSLSDLLKGEKEAILAITEKPDNQVITEYKNPVEIDLPKKPKHSSNYKFSTSTKASILEEGKIEIESVSERGKYEDATHRISTKPNNVIVVDFKPNTIDLDLSTEKSEISTTTPSTTTIRPNSETKSKFKHRLPITSAKLNNILKSATKSTIEDDAVSTTLPSKAYRININELFGISSIREKAPEENGPLRMSLDLNSVIEKKLLTSTKSPIETTTLEMMPEKLKAITAKDEILEILKDEETKEHLKKILEMRNMTIDDLVELRERGSSQKHLADLFHNETKEPEPKNLTFIGDLKTGTSNYQESSIKNPIDVHQFERQPKSHYHLPLELKDSNGDKYVASVETVDESNESKSIEETEDKDKYTVTSFPTYKIEMDKKFKEKAPTPDIWKNNYPDIFDDLYQRTHQKGIVEDINEKYFDEIRTIDEVENAILESGNEKLNVETSKETYEDASDYDVFIKLPYGVKHAIFASLLIIGISLVIFLTILMIFKWSQKHKKKFCYNGSFSCSKIKSPILQNSERKSFRTFVSETLGRKKHYYKQHLQSMSDSIWEQDRKPFQ